MRSRPTAASRTGASCCPISSGDPFAPRRTEVHWDDLVRGPETVDLASVSDPVLVRGDGSYLYTFTSVVDDIELGISHVIRGDDHVTNTGVQIAQFQALGAEPPVFGHHNTLTTSTGEGLSKRSGALSIAGLAESGIEPMAVVSLAVLIGTSENVVGDVVDAGTGRSISSWPARRNRHRNSIRPSSPCSTAC